MDDCLIKTGPNLIVNLVKGVRTNEYRSNLHPGASGRRPAARASRSCGAETRRGRRTVVLLEFSRGPRRGRQLHGPRLRVHEDGTNHFRSRGRAEVLGCRGVPSPLPERVLQSAARWPSAIRDAHQSRGSDP